MSTTALLHHPPPPQAETQTNPSSLVSDKHFVTAPKSNRELGLLSRSGVVAMTTRPWGQGLLELLYGRAWGMFRGASVTLNLAKLTGSGIN